MGFDFLFFWYLLLFLNLLRLLFYVVVVVCLCVFFFGSRRSFYYHRHHRYHHHHNDRRHHQYDRYYNYNYYYYFIIVIIMMNEIGIDKKHQLYIIKKMINIAITATYYIFCCRNRNWDSPDFFSFFCFCVVLFCVVFVLFCFFLLIIQSQAAFVNYLYVARFTIVHSKKQIKLPLLLYS